jgi:carbon monoxide dehydrogenase subunit G
MRVQASLDVLAPPEVVWGILADLTERARFMADLESWEHVSGPTTGEGGRYRLRTRIGPVALTSLVEIVDWKPPEFFSWTSLKGLRLWGRFTIRPAEGGSRVTFRLGYASSENLLGFVTDRIAAPMVRRQVMSTLHALGDEVVASLSGKVRGAGKRAADEARPASGRPTSGKGAVTAAPAEPVPRKPSARKPPAARKARRPKGLPREDRTPVRRAGKPG